MMRLVVRMLALHEKLSETKIERERTVIGHQTSVIPRRVGLVYEPYEPKEEEIGIFVGWGDLLKAYLVVIGYPLTAYSLPTEARKRLKSTP